MEENNKSDDNARKCSLNRKHYPTLNQTCCSHPRHRNRSRSSEQANVPTESVGAFGKKQNF